MIRRMKHSKGLKWRFTFSESARQVLSIVLAVSMTLSMIPTVAVRAFAEELAPGLEAVAEAVGDALDAITPDEVTLPEEAAPEAEAASAEEPAAPAEAAPAEVAPAETTAAAPEAPATTTKAAPDTTSNAALLEKLKTYYYQRQSQTTSFERMGAPAEGETVELAVETGDTPVTGTTNVYEGSVHLNFTVTGSDISATDYPTIQAYCFTFGFEGVSWLYELNSDTWTVDMGTGHATIELTKPGYYYYFTIKGGSCTSGGSIAELAGSTSPSPAITIDGAPALDYVYLLDADGNVIRDDENNVIDLTKITDKTMAEASKVKVRIFAGSLDYTDDPETSATVAELINVNGSVVATGTFEPDPTTSDFNGYVAEIEIPDNPNEILGNMSDGTYSIRVVAANKAGEKLVDADGNEFQLVCGTLVEQEDGTQKAYPDGNFIVDRSSPIAMVLYPIENVVSLYTPTAENSVTDTLLENADFFATGQKLTIGVIDWDLDFDNTTVFGISLAAIKASPQGAIPGISCTYTEEAADTSGRTSVTIEAMLGDGEYELDKILVANDTNDDHAASKTTVLDSESNVITPKVFIIDTAAPEVTAARFGYDESSLGYDADGDAIANPVEVGDNRVFFAAAGTAEPVISLTVEEPHGIRSIEMNDPTGTFTLDEGLGIEVNTGNSNHVSTFTLPLITSLSESDVFIDDITFTITDYAGNQYTWSMQEKGTARTVPGTTDYMNFETTNVDMTYGDMDYNMLYPTAIVIDDTPPTLYLYGPADRTDAVDPAYVRYFDEAQEVSAEVNDANNKFLYGFTGGDELYDPNGYVDGEFTGVDTGRVIITYDFTADTAGATTQTQTITLGDFYGATGSDSGFAWDTTASAEGHYTNISAEFIDIVGHTSGVATVDDFTIDTTAPVVEVTYVPDSSAASQSFFYGETITATITVTEHNFDPALFTITPSVTGGAQGQVAPAPSAWTDDGDTHTCTVVFNSDGSFSLQVEGKDKAGNEANAIDDGPFVIDTEAPVIAGYYANGSAPASNFDTDAPVVEIPAATGTYDDGSGIVYYFTHGIDVLAKVQDRNFDIIATVLYVTQDGTEAERTVDWYRVPDEIGPNSYELFQTTVSYGEDGEYTAPRVVTTDAAGNTSDNAADAEAMRLVLDLNPPELTVDVNRDPSAQGMVGGDPVNFYNQSTTMTFTVTDAHLLRSVEVQDPDGLYTVTKSDASAEGKGSVTLTATLKDGSGSQDGEFDRDITLTAEDLAGNSRTWSISPQGRITQDSVTSETTNVGINGGTEYPVALIQDTVAPVVALSGVTAGTYYNSPQQVLATVNEYNMEYLQQFDGGRTIVTVTNWSADAGRTQSSFTINAGEFSGSRPNYSFTQVFNTDGHYALSAQFQDYAGNLSNQVTIGEFTIDMTDPRISVEWDNNDARSGNYYKATRTATITVVEHNFDASRFTINTTGQVGSWSNNGDTHTITVFFGEGSAHNLSVSGSDLAGNQASPFSSPTFVVDLTAPEISIAGLAQRLGFLDEDDPESLQGAYLGELKTYNAYNGVVVPTITYTDNEVLSTGDLAFTITGNKNGADVDFTATTSDEATEMTTTFRDLGYVGPDAGDGSNSGEFYVDDYTPDADDIYTLTATMVDRAGNEAEAQIVFSVNRYGSNYIVSLDGLDPDEEAEYEASGMLSEAPTIVVHEVNVCGVDEDNHHVQKEFANATSTIQQNNSDGAGYDLTTIENKDQEVGWSEYVYTIRSANFGEGSDSDNNDRGQGTYRVNVMSDDYSSNANSTAAFWSSDAARQAVTAEGATTEFILDELAPVIDDLNLPEYVKAGESYEASFHVTDDITSGNKVQVFIDGEELAASEVQGSDGGVGTYTFSIPARSFDWGRSIRIVVTDYAGREVEATNENWLWLSTFIPEGVTAGAAVAAVVAGAVIAHKRKDAAEPELPE